MGVARTTHDRAAMGGGGRPLPFDSAQRAGLGGRHGARRRTRRGRTSSWHHFDALGSTDRLTDASENELASYVQTAFGVPKAVTGDHPNRLRWIGRLGYRWEPDAGQYDVRRRRYDAARGRWASADPDDAGIQRYSYSGNRPVSNVDPSGRFWGTPDYWWYGWPDIHREWTTDAARRAAIMRAISGKKCELTYPSGAWVVIGRNSGLVDFWFRFVDPYHFHPGREARSEFHYQQALRAARGGAHCQEAWAQLGRAVHPLQDVEAHLDLTPCDHLDASNNPYVDDPGFDRGAPMPSGVFARVPNAGFAYSEAVKHWKCEGTTVRRWRWVGGMGGPGVSCREIAARYRTCALVERFLREADGCFVKKRICGPAPAPKSCY